jgi:TPR repeat protein
VKTIIVLVVVFVFIGFLLRPDVAHCQLVGSGSSITGVSPLNGAGEAELQQQQQVFAEQQAQLEQQAANQVAIDQEKQTEILAQLQSLKDDEATKLQGESDAQTSVEVLLKKFLDSKKLIPKDPWREIDGDKKYVMSADSDFVKFSGQIQQVATNGVLVLGQCGNSLDVEYFILNFPYRIGEGENIDPLQFYVAIEDGKFSYLTEDGSSKSVPKLNYGNLCARPSNADLVELAAQQLTPEEESQLNNAKSVAEQEKAMAVAAQKQLQDFLDQNDAGRIAAIQKKKTEQLALKFNQDQADKGDPIGLLRMGERYRDGDGVPKDLDKAREFFGKAAAAGEPTAEDELSKLNQSSSATKNSPTN